uniref:Uncharacterized protein LOC114342134 n=1 Tax=Diabrotica virgifera virgifera TaxID=50390 RepID=A0A6P7GG78_DIAVI
MPFSSRNKEIMRLVKVKACEIIFSPSKRTYQDMKKKRDQENIDPESDCHQAQKKLNTLSNSVLLEIDNAQSIAPVVSPKEMEDIIKNATVVFDDSFSCLENIHETLDLLENNSIIENSLENNHTSLQNVMESTNQEKEDSGESYEPEMDDESSDTNSSLSFEIERDASNATDQEINKPKNKKKQKGENKKEKNKLLRMRGEKYLGFRKPAGQRNTFHDKSRTERKMKARL